MNIRLAEEKDAHSIALVHIASWQKIYRGHVPDVILDNLSVTEREQQWRELIKNGVTIFLIEKNNSCIGFASFGPSRDEDTDAKKCGEISAIYLDPNSWHKGLGAILCHHVLAQLKTDGYQEVILWVLKENHQARRFYKKIGFISTDKIKLDAYEESIFLEEVRYHRNFFSFLPLAKSHFQLLCDWLDKPHVKTWWNEGLTHEEVKVKYTARIDDPVVFSFIIDLKGQPIGLIQYYHANQVGGGWWPNESDGTVGIDQFIGEEQFINQGYGTQLIQDFCRKLFEGGNVKKIIVDVDPANNRAIKCYQKVGFQFVKELITPDGRAYLYELKNYFIQE